MITPDLVVFYLANIIKMSQTDGKMNPKAQRALKEVCKSLPMDNKTLKGAAGMVSGGGHVLTPVGRFSDKVRNLEDMLYVALVDGELSGSEREEIQGFVEKIHVTEQQARTILTETKIKLDLQMVATECSKCGTNLVPGTKVCPVCSEPIATGNPAR